MGSWFRKVFLPKDPSYYLIRDALYARLEGRGGGPSEIMQLVDMIVNKEIEQRLNDLH